MKQKIVDEDILGLTERRAEPLVPATIPLVRFSANQPAYSQSKIIDFLNWLMKAEQDGILTTFGPKPGSFADTARDLFYDPKPPWWRTYIQTSYRQALQQAGGNLAGQGVAVSPSWFDNAFLSPVHADRAAIIYTRTYTQLSGITSELDGRISRVLAEGISSGLNPRVLANDLADELDWALYRAERLAQTEIINAHAEATLNAYEEAQVEGVQLDAEFSYTDDNKVCPRCVELGTANGGIYSVEEARGLIPVHPNCRCAWIPIVKDPYGKKLGTFF